MKQMEFYKVTSIDEITPEIIFALVERYKIKEVPRLKRLNHYYKGHSDIKNRVLNDPTKPNNKVANPYGAFIVDTIQGYFLGKPVTYSSSNDDFITKLQDVYDKNHEHSHNSRMGKQLSISGIAYELMYMNEVNEIKFSMLDPKEVFMIYDNSIDMKPLMAVRFYHVHNYVTEETIQHIEVYTDSMVYYYIENDGDLSIQSELPHYFKQVPVNCYFNNDEAMGDFEKVMDLIDAYDLAVSDTANNLDYFADAYLVLNGMGATEQADIQNMKENRIMLLDEGADAKWLIKGTQDIQVEEFKNRVKEDIHNFSQVPNLSDEQFGSATSGESLKYKLFGLENAVAIKERNFMKGLETRIEAITNILNIKGGQFDPNDLTMQFTRNLPSNLATLADVVSKLNGIVAHETLLSILPFVDDPASELQKIEHEQQGNMYGSFFNNKNVTSDVTGNSNNTNGQG